MSNPIIQLDSEGVRILVDTDEGISKNYNISTEGAIVKCIKHIYRYNEFTMPKDIMIRILWLAFKGLKCKTHHLDIFQRDSLYQYFKDNEVDDPYIQEFIKQSKEIFKH